MLNIISKIDNIRLGDSRQIAFNVDPPPKGNALIAVSKKISTPIYILGIKFGFFDAIYGKNMYRILIAKDDDKTNVNEPSGRDLFEIISNYDGIRMEDNLFIGFIPINKFYLDPPYYFKEWIYNYDDNYRVKRTIIIVFREVWL